MNQCERAGGRAALRRAGCMPWRSKPLHTAPREGGHGCAATLPSGAQAGRQLAGGGASWRACCTLEPRRLSSPALPTLVCIEVVSKTASTSLGVT